MEVARQRVLMAEFPEAQRRNRMSGDLASYVPLYRKYLEWGFGCLGSLEKNASALSSNLGRRGVENIPEGSVFFKIVQRLPPRISALKKAYIEISRAGLNYARSKASLISETERRAG